MALNQKQKNCFFRNGLFSIAIRCAGTKEMPKEPMTCLLNSQGDALKIPKNEPPT